MEKESEGGGEGLGQGQGRGQVQGQGQGQGQGEALDLQAILKLLPHRPPFLLIDRVTSLTADRVVAIKNVTINEPYFVGHFPGHPVMPGVLIVEAMAQAGAVLAVRGADFDPARQVIYFMALDRVKFRRPVVPGDQLVLTVEPLRRGSSIWRMQGQAAVGDQVVCSAEFLASVAPRRD